MRENQLIALVRTLMMVGFTSRGVSNILVAQNYQPTQQGRTNAPTMYMTLVSNHRYGWPQKKDVWDSTNSVMVRTLTEHINSTLQFGFTSVVDADDISGLTTTDYAKLAASIMQDDPFQQGLIAGGADIMRITDIRSTPVQNDRDQWEKNPSFDAVFNHNDVFVTTSPIIEKFDSKIRRV